MSWSDRAIRQVAMKTPSMLSAPFIEQSDLLMALPRRVAETMAAPPG